VGVFDCPFDEEDSRQVGSVAADQGKGLMVRPRTRQWVWNVWHGVLFGVVIAVVALSIQQLSEVYG
jgi:hypothetical protein